jgi:NADH dehydrogenase FAD-containing subunit
MASSTGVPDLRDHAVVIGASIAGLLAARALSETYARVTVIDRDTHDCRDRHFRECKGRENDRTYPCVHFRELLMAA